MLSEIVKRADAGERFAICLLAKTTGSTPQKSGALMLVDAMGKILGTIGGGCVEAEVRAEAMRRLARNETMPDSLLRFPLDDDYGWDDGLVCGGVMYVALQVVQAPEKIGPWRKAATALSQGQIASVSISAVDESGAATELTYSAQPPPTLIIAGAGHVGAALAKVAVPTGFDVMVIDDRADAASAHHFPNVSASNRIIGPIESELRKQKLGDHHYVVIVTRGHKHDADALRAVIQSDARYIGLIGSRRKVLSIFERLIEEGVHPERLRRVHAPIGLKIGAISPEEIAVSIAAELIACRRNQALPGTAAMHLEARYLDRLSKRSSPTHDSE